MPGSTICPHKHMAPGKTFEVFDQFNSDSSEGGLAATPSFSESYSRRYKTKGGCLRQNPRSFLRPLIRFAPLTRHLAEAVPCRCFSFPTHGIGTAIKRVCFGHRCSRFYNLQTRTTCLRHRRRSAALYPSRSIVADRRFQAHSRPRGLDPRADADHARRRCVGPSVHPLSRRFRFGEIGFRFTRWSPCQERLDWECVWHRWRR